jgi:hypothetical protein
MSTNEEWLERIVRNATDRKFLVESHGDLRIVTIAGVDQYVFVPRVRIELQDEVWVAKEVALHIERHAIVGAAAEDAAPEEAVAGDAPPEIEGAHDREGGKENENG